MIKIEYIKPSQWLISRMESEVKHHVVDKLPELLPDLFGDDLFSSDRIGPKTQPKDLGTIENDSSWNAQFYWWNSETIGNYYDGLMRYGYLLNDQSIHEKAKKFIGHILASQDDDGYLGIYTNDFRYTFTSENGELWSKTTIGRLLLGYYRLYSFQPALEAVIKMTKNVMYHWPIHQSEPFSGSDTFAGVAHGLMFVDILYELYEITDRYDYIEYALFLYEDYNKHEVSEPDCLIRNLNDPTYRFQGHGVHTYEHMRAIAIYDVFSDKNLKLYSKYMQKLSYVISPSGGPIGDEWIMGNIADANLHGYEFCSIHELMVSLIFVSKIGLDNQYPLVRKIFLNANLGSRHITQHTIAYLKSDNSYSMTGSFHQHQPHSPHQIQTRYKYSPTHQDAAVCCVPNSVRITPYYIDGIISVKDDSVILNYIAPIEVGLKIDDTSYFIRVIQDSPYAEARIISDLEEKLVIHDNPAEKALAVKLDQVGNVFFEWNGIVFAYPIPSVNRTIKLHSYGLKDIHVKPRRKHIPLTYRGDLPHLVLNNDRPEVHVTLYHLQHEIKAVLIPIAETVLRQVTFRAETT